MLALDELQELDSHRKNLRNEITGELENWITVHDLETNIKLKQYQILLISKTELSEEIIHDFEEDFQISLMKFKKIENHNIYEGGSNCEYNYFFKSSGGIF